jgi:hypothetical protein
MVILKSQRETLLAPLQAVSGIVERRHTLPILSNVMLEKKGDVLTLVATDIEIQITTETRQVGGEEDGAVTVGARKLQDILRSLPDSASITLDLDWIAPKPDSGKRIKALFDGGGLYLEVSADVKRWRLKFRAGGKGRLLSLGTYPEVSLGEARAKRESIRKKLEAGIDPVEEKKAEKAVAEAEAASCKMEQVPAETFRRAATQWFDAWKVNKAPAHVDRVWGMLQKNVLSWIGDLPVSGVRRHDIFSVCDRIRKRGAIETAHRVLGYFDAIFKHVIVVDTKNEDIEEGRKPPRIIANPCEVLRGRDNHLLQPVPPKKHFAHFKDERTGSVSTAKLGEFLRAVDAFSGSLQVLAALRLAPMLFCRPGELRMMR